MTYIVSYTDFRKNMSDYADLIANGATVTVRDEKRETPLFKVVQADEGSFDWDDHLNWIRNFKPFLDKKDEIDYKNRREKSKLRLKRNSW